MCSSGAKIILWQYNVDGGNRQKVLDDIFNEKNCPRRTGNEIVVELVRPRRLRAEFSKWYEPQINY